MFKLGSRSLGHLEGVKEDMCKVVLRAIQITTVDFSVVDGLRTLEEQKRYFASGASKTMKSRHLDGEAVDIYPWVDGKTSHAANHYDAISTAMFKAAKELGVEIEWGGHFKSIIDKPHWQLKRG